MEIINDTLKNLMIQFKKQINKCNNLDGAQQESKL